MVKQFGELNDMQPAKDISQPGQLFGLQLSEFLTQLLKVAMVGNSG